MGIPKTTLLLSELTQQALEAEFSQRPSESPAGRVVEFIEEKAPQLMPSVPFILAICEMYHQRKIRAVK